MEEKCSKHFFQEKVSLEIESDMIWYYIASGLFIAALFFSFWRFYNSYKIYSKFPFLHLFPVLIDYHVTKRPPKDIPFSCFAFQNLIKRCQEFTKEGLVLTYLMRPMLIVFGEEPIKVFLNEKIAGDKPREYKFLEEIFGSGLITSNGERWKNHRKMLNPSFQIEMLKERVPLFNEHASALVKDLETLPETPSIDPLDLIKCHYFNALTESVFGLKECEENKAENLNYFHMVDSLSSMGIYLFAHPWLQWRIFHYISPSSRKFKQLQNEMFTFTKNVITRMENIISTDEARNLKHFGRNMRKSLTYILLQHHLNDPSFTFEDLHAEVTTFMSAGYDTVSYATMWCLFLLGLYPEIQEKVFDEVYSASQDYISYEEISNFTYLKAVIMETLRLYPIIPIYGRETTENVKFGKYSVPKRTYIAIFPYLLHRNPDVYPDPEKFEPERFLEKGCRNTWNHIPFAEGNRTCIGRKYALIEMMIFLAHMLRKFKVISLDKREDIQLCYNIVLTPSKPLRMLFTPRSMLDKMPSKEI